MRTCSGQRHTGERCAAPPLTDGDFCLWHDPEHADILVTQFQDTAGVRKWSLEAASAMYNHVHIVVGVVGDPEPDTISETFKSWGTRALKKKWPLPSSGRWWTRRSSERKLPDQQAVRDAVIYVVKKQPNPLAVWFVPKWTEILEAFDLANR